MKRTIERILAWLGIITQLFILLGLGIGAMFGGTSEVQKEIKRQAKEQAASNPAVDSSSHMSELLPSIFKVGLIYGLVILVIALIATLLIKKKAKLAGVLLIIAAVLSLVMNWIAALFWIIAGIMLLTKSNQQRPKRDQTVHNHQEDYSKRNEWDPEKELKEHQQKDKPYTY